MLEQPSGTPGPAGRRAGAQALHLATHLNLARNRARDPDGVLRVKAERLEIPAIILITPPRHEDARGFFSETYNAASFAEAGVHDAFVQDNHSLSRQAGVVRGLHCQVPPFAQGKLIRCLRGSIWDVVVDVRAGSPSYGKWVGARLSARNWLQLWVPAGFLHGFCTLEPNTEVNYKVTAPYDRASERGVSWDDPDLALPWPVSAADALLSDKDAALPGIAAAEGWFGS